MLPTPSKSHYIFNFRDLSKLNNGLMQANALVVVNKNHLVDLFAHECIRVFNDRLITHEDNVSFYEHLSFTILDYFKVEYDNPYNRALRKGDSQEEEEKSQHKQQKDSQAKQKDPEPSKSPVEEDAQNNFSLYGDFIKNDERIYQPLRNWKQLVSVLSEYQMRSNMAGHSTKQIVFFKEAVEHICRLVKHKRPENGVCFISFIKRRIFLVTK